MAETIPAKCFGCGFVLRLPSTMGGQNVKCMKCGFIITVPSPADSQIELITDEKLPEVARDDEALEPEVIPEPEPKTEKGTRGISGSSSRTPAFRGRRVVEPAAGNNSGLVIGVMAGIGVLLLLVVLVTSRKSESGPPKPESPKPDSERTQLPQPDPEAGVLRDRCRSFIQAVNKGQMDEILAFYVTESDKERLDVKALYSEKVPQWREIGTIEATVLEGQGTTLFTCDRILTDTWTKAETEEKAIRLTFRWKKVQGEWRIKP